MTLTRQSGEWNNLMKCKISGIRLGGGGEGNCLEMTGEKNKI